MSAALAIALIAAGLAAQGLAGAILVGAVSGTLLAAAGAHLVGSLLAAEGLCRCLPAHTRRPAVGVRAALALGVLLVPLAGVLGLALGLVPFVRWPRRKVSHVGLETTGAPGLPIRAGVATMEVHGQGSLFGRLRNATDPTIRLRAVMAARQMRGRAAIPLLKLALRDPSDEVRLLGYAILDQREGEIYRRINDLTAELARAEEREQAMLRLRLGEQYWELAYHGLAEGELLKFVLDQARTQLEAARALDPKDGATLLLLGRVQCKQKDYPAARESFLAARASGLPDRVVGLHLAEVAFKERRYDDLRRELATVAGGGFVQSTVRHIAEYWQ